MSSKDKGVFTITVTLTTQNKKDGAKQKNDFKVKTASVDKKAAASKETSEIKEVKKESVDNTKVNQSPNWSKDKIAQRAKSLLSLSDSQINVPEVIFANAEGGARNSIRENYLKRRKFYLTELAQGKLPHISTDADGTCTFKTVAKVENSRSIGSLQDKHFLRLLVKAVGKLGAYFEINTARTGFIPGPSLVGTEGPKFKDGKEWYNPRSPNEISGIMHEFGIHNLQDAEAKELYNNLIVNGLSAGARHDPRNGGSLTVAEATRNYGKFVDKINHIKLPDAPDGFLSALEKIVANKDEKKPLKVLEYKSIPWAFINDPSFKAKDYFDYIALAENKRDKNLTDAQFFEQLNKSKIQLPAGYYDASNPPKTEAELTNKLRASMLACLTPHAFDSDNIVRDEKKLEFYKTLAKFSRSAEAQEWAEKELGIAKGTDLFTINGYDVSHVDFDNFDKQYKDLAALINELDKSKKAPPKKEHVLVNVVENLQPYCEIAPNTSKADVMPSVEAVRAENKFVIGAGDSPGSDAVLLAQAIILGGAGFVVRGLMDEKKVLGKVIEQLTKAENQWHDMAMSTAGQDSNGNALYKMNKTGEVKTAAQWLPDFEKAFGDKVLRCNNIHENNAFNAAVFSEFFSGDKGFDLKVDENAGWAKTVLNEACRKSLVTPISDAGDKALEGQVYEKPILKALPFLGAIPFFKGMFDPYTAGKTTQQLLGAVSNVLIASAPIEIAADLMGAEKAAWAARMAQRISYGVNTIASGVSRGLLLSPHKFSWQFVGELFGLASTFLPQTSTLGRTLRAVNQTVLIGRANELAMRTNYNLDGFKDKDKMKKEYGTNNKAKDLYFDKKNAAAKYTKSMMKDIDFMADKLMLRKVPGGHFMASTLAQFKQAASMAWDFVTVPQLRKNTIKNFFSNGVSGPIKMSKNSGKAYGEVHEENTYAFAGMATLGTAIASTVLGNLTGSKAVDTVLTNIANMIPALGIVTAGKLVEQDQAGDPRVFTDIAKKQQNYSPEKAGRYQKWAGWAVALTGAFQHTKLGAVLYNAANGLYFKGIQEQLKVGVDDAAVNKATREGRYYVRDRDAKEKAPVQLKKKVQKPAPQADMKVAA